jgi:hypothetical protein
VDSELVVYEHPRLGFRVPLPSGWEQAPDPMERVALVSVEPDRGGPWFRANVVVTVDDVPPGLDLAGWHAVTEEWETRLLSDYLLIDREFSQRGDRTVLRRLAHHTTEMGAVTLEQWSVLTEHTAYTLSASVATLECVEMADLFAEIAAGFAPAAQAVS